MVNISLTSPMRSNLLALQNISKVQSATQERLSTGLKVSNAIDNPASYYTAQSLSNRANDLNSLLDSMGQGIQTIKATSDALEAGTKLLQQAKASANSAMDSIAGDINVPVPPEPPVPEVPKFPIEGEIIANVTNEDELLAAIATGNAGIIVIDKNITMSKNVGLELKNGQSLVGAKWEDSTAAETKITFDFDSRIKAIGIDLGNNSALSDLVIDYTSATKTSNEDFHAVRNKSGNSAQLNNIEITANTNSTQGYYMSGIRNLGNIDLFGNIDINSPSTLSTYAVGIYGANDNSSNIIQNKDSTLNINTKGNSGHAIISGTNILNGTTNINTYNKAAHGVALGITTANGTLNITTKATESRGVYYGESTLNGIITINTESEVAYGIDGGLHTMNGTVNINTSGYNTHGIYQSTVKISSTGQLLTNTESTSANIFTRTFIKYEIGAKIGVKTNSYPVTNDLLQANVSNFTGNSTTGNTINNWVDFKRLGDFPIPAPAKLSSILEKKSAEHDNQSEKLTEEDNKTQDKKTLEASVTYNNILEQYNALIKDAGYKGINLLDMQNMKINFNEDRSSTLDVLGVDASSKGLALGKAEWLTKDDILASIDELDSAINQLRTYSNEFGNYLNTVATREDFTDNLTSVLTEGADKLTLTDMNEESANMLALQTRQQLAINSLSLSSQAAQSILSLF